MADVSIVIDSISRIHSKKDVHETFAWVAATGKPELFVRDHLGADIAIHIPDVIVSREWHKHDLAILDLNINPLVVIEGKALYDFDILDKGIRRHYHRAISRDREKLIDRGAPSSLISLLMTSIRSPIHESLRRVTKYSPGSNKGLEKHGLEMMSKATRKAKALLSDFGNVIHETELAVGLAMKYEVHLWMWLVDIN